MVIGGARRAMRALVATAIAAGGVGCAVIAGLEDHHLDDVDAAAPPADGPGADDATDAAAATDGAGDAPRDAPTDGPLDAAPPAPETLATGQGAPRGIAVDATYVYWVNESAGTLVRLPKAGGNVVVLASGLVGPQHIAVDAQRVYVQSFNGTATPGAAVVVAVRKEPADASGDVVTLATGNAGGRAAALALPDAIFLADAGTGDAAPADDYVWFVDMPGLSARRVRREGPVNSDTLAGPIAFSTPAKPVYPAIAVDDQNIYYGDQTGPASATANFVHAKRDGTSGSTIFVAGAKVIDIRLDVQSVFWIAQGGAVNRLDKTLGGTAPTTLASGSANPEGMAMDATYVYWTNPGGGDVRRVPKVTGKTSSIATAQGGPSGVTVDATQAGAVVYWTNRGDGTVKRVLTR
jgi:hypothetical protein